MGRTPTRSKKKSRAPKSRSTAAIGTAVPAEKPFEDGLLVGVIGEGAPTDFNNPANWLFRRIQNSVWQASKRHPSTIRVQFIVMVSSPLVKPDFVGVQTGSFIRARNQLNVVIAVPDPLEESLVQFLIAAIQDGWGLAQEYFRRKRLGDRITPLEQAVGEVLQELRQEPQPVNASAFRELVAAELRWLIDEYGFSIAPASRLEGLPTSIVLSNPASHVRVSWEPTDPKTLAIELGTLSGKEADPAYVAGQRYPLWLLAWVRSWDKAYALSLMKLGGASKADVQAGLRSNSWAMQRWAADVLAGDFSVFELLDTAHDAVLRADAEQRPWPPARTLKSGTG